MIIYEFEVDEVNYTVPEEDVQQLLERFNLDNIKDDTISIPCICANHNNRCGTCPLKNCFDILELVKLLHKYIRMTEFSIRWSFYEREQAYAEITAIRNWILTWKKSDNTELENEIV